MDKISQIDFAFACNCECSEGWFAVRFQWRVSFWAVSAFGSFPLADKVEDIKVLDETINSLACGVFFGTTPVRLLGDRLIELGFTEMGSLLASDFS